MYLWLFFALILSVINIPAFADNDDTENDAEPQIALGLGVLLETATYREADNEALVLPYISASYKNFYLKGLKAGYRFSTDKSPVELGVFVSGRLEGYEDDDSDYLEDMDERKYSLDGGVDLEWEQNNWSVELSLASDLLNRHQGQEANLEVGYKFIFNKSFVLQPSVEVQWQSDNLVDYYYGVRAEEARNGRPAYEGSSTINYELGLSGYYNATENLFFVVKVGYTLLGDEIADSPIVEKDYQIESFLGAAWRF